MPNQISNVNFQDPYQAESADIAKRRALAEAMQQQSMQQDPTQSVNGWAVRQPKSGMLAKLLQAGAGAYGQQSADKEKSALQQKYQSALSDTMERAQAAGAGTPAIPSPADELGGGPGRPQGPPDRREMARILRGHPATQQMGMQMMTQDMQPPTRVDGGDKWLLVNSQQQVVGTLPKNASPDATLKEAGSDRRHATPSGSAQLGSQTTLQTHATPSGSSILGDQRARSEGALGRENTMDIAQMGDARAREAAQAGRIPPGYRATSDGGLEATPGGPADAKEDKKTGEIKKNIDMYVAARDGLMTGLEGSTTGPALGRMPAVTTGQQVAEGGVAAMAPVLKQLFRVAGEGVFTDRDQDLLISMVPKRSDNPEARTEKMANIDRIVSAKLGQPVPARGAAGAEKSPAGAPRVVDW